jgi:hypothetical protein
LTGLVRAVRVQKPASIIARQLLRHHPFMQIGAMVAQLT